MQPIVEDYQTFLKGDVLLVTDPAGRVLGRAGRFGADADAVARILNARPDGATGSWFWAYPGGVLLVTAVPMDFLGTLVVGASLDRAVVERIKGLTHSDIALVSGSTVVVSTLPADQERDLLPGVGGREAALVRLGAEDFVIRAHTLSPAGVAGVDLTALVLRSRTAQMAFLPLLHREILLTGLGAVLIATVLGYGIARTVTRPLRAVTATMREISATGNLTRAGPAEGRWDDEDARLLSATFRQLTASLDRFQREAAQRERLSSLGRLSTVVAHEVRNPLMIIKATIQTLRRDSPTEAVREAAASIEEEVARLNRVVSDVLDFARPVQFVLDRTHLVELCRSAALASASGPGDVPVTVETPVPPEDPWIVTDADRLRAVLVNVLTNAQIAVGARADREDPAPILLTVSRTLEGGARLVVTDRGVGIDPGDLPRVFDPFFTTRPSGSGLGLAIARNIVEGLGGTIDVRSQLGRGTTVDIHLPAGVPPAADRRPNGPGRVVGA